MRVIKFRIFWDGVMFYSPSVMSEECYEGTGATNIDHCYLYLNKVLEDISNNDKIMQYTGIKDKNGKDVYEGDIFKSSKLKNNFNVVFCEESGKWKLKNEKSFNLSLYSSFEIMKCEVIGNIYENPEIIVKGE